jgi:hypothetical protein
MLAHVGQETRRPRREPPTPGRGPPGWRRAGSPAQLARPDGHEPEGEAGCGGEQEGVADPGRAIETGLSRTPSRRSTGPRRGPRTNAVNARTPSSWSRWAMPQVGYDPGHEERHAGADPALAASAARSPGQPGPAQLAAAIGSVEVSVCRTREGWDGATSLGRRGTQRRWPRRITMMRSERRYRPAVSRGRRRRLPPQP